MTKHGISRRGLVGLAAGSILLASRVKAFAADTVVGFHVSRGRILAEINPMPSRPTS